VSLERIHEIWRRIAQERTKSSPEGSGDAQAPPYFALRRVTAMLLGFLALVSLAGPDAGAATLTMTFTMNGSLQLDGASYENVDFEVLFCGDSILRYSPGGDTSLLILGSLAGYVSIPGVGTGRFMDDFVVYSRPLLPGLGICCKDDDDLISFETAVPWHMDTSAGPLVGIQVTPRHFYGGTSIGFLNVLGVNSLVFSAVLSTGGPGGCECGNGTVEPGEACDDGDNRIGDCCAPDCDAPEDQDVVPESEFLSHFQLGGCDPFILLPGTHNLGDMTDGAGNTFSLRCEVGLANVRLVLKYDASDGSCTGDVAECSWFQGGNDWNLRRDKGDLFNCFTRATWRSIEPRSITNTSYCAAGCSGDYCQGACNMVDSKPFDFDPQLCDPLLPPLTVLASGSTGLTIRDFTSPDGPGGPLGDVMTAIQTNAQVSLNPLPSGPLTIDYLNACDNDRDEDCDLDDYVLIGGASGTCEGDANFNEPADVDRDGCVTQVDLEWVVEDCSILVGDSIPTSIGLVSHNDLVAGVDAEFHVVAGALSDLRAAGNFDEAICLAGFVTSTVDAMPDPPVGDGRYYLVRGVGHCLSYGDSSLIPDPRDALDAANPCP